MSLKQSPWVLCAVLLLSSATGVWCLKGVWLKVPQAVAPGQSATLLCGYDLEGEPLYTVKWYKGRQEFFRYVPKEHPDTRVFPLPGFNVDVSRVKVSASGPGRVVLRDIQMDMAGKYRCEVSADAPDFHTEVVSAHMHVVHMEEGEPLMRLEKTRYSLGDTLRGNCSSPPSVPPANITWLVNGNKVPTTSIDIAPSVDGQSVTTSNLEIEVNTFMLGKIRITCIADVFNVYLTQTELVLDEERPRLAPVLAGVCTQRSGSTLLLMMLLHVGLAAR